jgi:hypothetical protein
MTAKTRRNRMHTVMDVTNQSYDHLNAALSRIHIQGFFMWTQLI